MDPDLKDYFLEQERLSDKIFIGKSQIVDLDRARQSNRESMSRLQRHKMPDEPNKHWVQVGSLWLKMEENKLEANLKEKQEQLSRKIDSLRNKVRDEAIKLEELQDPDTIAKHFNLKSLSKDELQSFYPSRNAF